MESKLLKLLLFLWGLAPALTGVLDSRAAAEPLITLSTDQVAAGKTLAVSIDSKESLNDVQLRFGDQIGHLFHPPGAAPRQMAGLLAVPFKTKIGPRALSVRWKQSGRLRQKLFAFTVVEGKYRSERLKVDPAKVSPSKTDQKRAAKEAREVRRIYADASAHPGWETAFQRPLDSAITSPFGNRRLFNGKLASYHSGVDFRAPVGTPVKASNSGKVRLAKNLFYAGNTVLIDHGAGIFTIYAHLSQIGVTVNESVAKGQVIGKSGRSGRVSGPHLHWGVKLNGQNVDPLQFMALLAKLTR